MRTLAYALSLARAALAYDNGAPHSKLPPIGWSSWVGLGPGSQHPLFDWCDEDSVKQTIDAFNQLGFKEAGYASIRLADCWAGGRDEAGKLFPEKENFPNGMKPVVDYAHENGLAFGLYTDGGETTCVGGRPASKGHHNDDAGVFADWGVDIVKMDWCDTVGMDPLFEYTSMSRALNATGRPIHFNMCEWGKDNPWEWGEHVAQSWRATYDHTGTWKSVKEIVGETADRIPANASGRPFGWNDMDMLQSGNYDQAAHANSQIGIMTATEYKTEFSMWAISASPLIVSTPLMNCSDGVRRGGTRHGNSPTLPRRIRKDHRWIRAPAIGSALAVPGIGSQVTANPCDETEAMQFDWVLGEPVRLGALALRTIWSTSTGLCVDASKDPGWLTLAVCTGNETQLWDWDESSGTLRAPLCKNTDDKLNGCFGVGGGAGPNLEITGCPSELDKRPPNFAFVFGADGSWTSNDGSHRHPLRCMQAVPKGGVEVDLIEALCADDVDAYSACEWGNYGWNKTTSSVWAAKDCQGYFEAWGADGDEWPTGEGSKSWMCKQPLNLTEESYMCEPLGVEPVSCTPWISDLQKEILFNTEVIAVNQQETPQGRPLPGGDRSVWIRHLTDGDVAVAFYNEGDADMKAYVNFTSIGWTGTTVASVRDLWEHKDLGDFTGRFPESLSVSVEPHATMMVRLTPGVIFV